MRAGEREDLCRSLRPWQRTGAVFRDVRCMVRCPTLHPSTIAPTHRPPPPPKPSSRERSRLGRRLWGSVGVRDACRWCGTPNPNPSCCARSCKLAASTTHGMCISPSRHQPPPTSSPAPAPASPSPPPSSPSSSAPTFPPAPSQTVGAQTVGHKATQPHTHPQNPMQRCVSMRVRVPIHTHLPTPPPHPHPQRRAPR